MQFHSVKGVRKAKLTQTEIHKLTDAQLIVKDLSQFFPEIKTVDEAIARIDSSGVVRQLETKPDEEKSADGFGEVDRHKVGI